jgi:peptide-methionine (S)-S-oxide reductase
MTHSTITRMATTALLLVFLGATVKYCVSRYQHIPSASEALPGRTTPMVLTRAHAVFGSPIDATPEAMEIAYFAMGCFWGAEKLFFDVPGVVSTAVGYAGGATPNPTYEEVCSGDTGHAETVRVVFDPSRVRYEALLRVFWEKHDPTQGMRQGNDLGTQYRSAIYTTSDTHYRIATTSRDAYARALRAAGHGTITTEIRAGVAFYFAETHHQQYCALNPTGYCFHDGTGVSLSLTE